MPSKESTNWEWALYVTASGVEKVDGTNAESYDGAITVGTSPDRLTLGQGGYGRPQIRFAS